MDSDFMINNSKTIALEMPLKIKNLLKLCLDPENLDSHLITFDFNTRRRFFYMVAITKRHFIKANSLGWSQGNIIKDIGYEVIAKNSSNKVDFEEIIRLYPLVNKKRLAQFLCTDSARHANPQDIINKPLKDKLAKLKKLAYKNK